MPKNAKAYIALVIASGTTLLLLAAGSWSSASLRQFAIYLGLAALASTLKVRVPGIEGTMSPNFVFILLGVVTRSFSEVVAIGLTAALVQTLWASSKRPRMIQTAFNAAALIVSAGAAYKFSHAAGAADGAQAAVAGVILAGSVYFPLNSALVSIVVALVEGRPLKQVGRKCYENVFPYFMGGIIFAGLVTGAYTRSTAWKGALAVVPAVLLGYIYFSHRMSHTIPAISLADSSKNAAVEEDYPVEVNS